jgi:hypothetical protein
VRELKSRGVTFTAEVADHGYGLVTYFKAPGGIQVQLYEPRYVKGNSRVKSRETARPKAKPRQARSAKAKPRPARSAEAKPRQARSAKAESARKRTAKRPKAGRSPKK